MVEHTSGHGQGSEIFPPESVSEVVHTLVEEARMLDDGTLVAALTEYQKVVAEEFAASLDLASEPAETQNGSEDEI
ncbi:hypothetical protein BST34_21660 [Mycolicibacterium monacense DSM 44395]|nr:hypothetical protein [Mycolicibacterium monacense DSM 44395]ORB15449.1 hypothetical protein BST34_21660 [Mycolicibacterium monacense DSM 44395]